METPSRPALLPGMSLPPDPVDEIVRRLEAGEREIVLTGAAGTGKTTVVRALLQRVGRARTVILTAPTGRAARRLREVTGRAATTVHSAIYFPPREQGEELIWLERKTLGEFGHTLLVVDEASMVGSRLADDIRLSLTMEHGNTILWVGDSHQLPPVSDAPGVDLNGEDVIRLSVVWRSKAPLVQFAHRLLKAPKVRSFVEVLRELQVPGVYRRTSAEADPAVWRAGTRRAGADTALVTRSNARRHDFNRRVRTLLDREVDRVYPDDLLLVRTNHHGVTGGGVLNGEILRIEEVHEDLPDMPGTMLGVTVSDPFGDIKRCNLLPSSFGLDTREFRDAIRDESLAWERKYTRGAIFKDPQWQEESRRYKTGDLDSRGQLLGPAATTIHADWGEALTCHSTQGGEFDFVGVHFEEWGWVKGELEEARAWWYTAVTRAREALVLWLD